MCATHSIDLEQLQPTQSSRTAPFIQRIRLDLGLDGTDNLQSIRLSTLSDHDLSVTVGQGEQGLEEGVRG